MLAVFTHTVTHFYFAGHFAGMSGNIKWAALSGKNTR
jgi:hypothetical protein